MTIGLGHYLAVAAILFTLGIFGIFLNRKNVIIILMSIELILLAVNINLVAFSAFFVEPNPPPFAVLVVVFHFHVHDRAHAGEGVAHQADEGPIPKTYY